MSHKPLTAKYKGAGLITVSALFFASYGIWSRLMQQGLGEFSQAWTRAAFLLPILILIGFLTKKFRKIHRKDLKWFVLIGMMGGLNQAPYYYAFEHLTVGTATLFFYTALTVSGYIFGRLFFKEHLTKPKLIALGLAIVGLLSMFQLELSGNQLPAALASLAAGCMGAVAVVFSKKLSSNYSEIQTIMSYLVIMLLANFILSQLTHETLPPATAWIIWLPAVGYAFSFMVANLAVVAGFKYLEPSVGALIGLLEIIFAVIMGTLLFHDQVSLGLVLGSGLILLGIALPELVNVLAPDRKKMKSHTKVSSA